MMQLPHKIALILFIALMAHFAFYYPSLPEIIATNFGGGGKPQGWMSKSTFILFDTGLVLLVGFLMFGVPLLVKNIPHSLVNIPNRHYWLAEGRKEKTVALLHREMGWIFVGFLCFFIVVNHLVFQANLSDPIRLSSWFMVILIGFLVFIAIWVFKFLIIFRKPK